MNRTPLKDKVKNDKNDSTSGEENEVLPKYFTSIRCNEKNSMLNVSFGFTDSEGEEDEQVGILNFNSDLGNILNIPLNASDSEDNFNNQEDANSIVYDLQSSAKSRYICEYCSKLFSRKDSQLRHERTHDIASKVSCNMCDLTFRDNYELRFHIKINHEGKHLCCTSRSCNHYFKSKSGLINHELKVHKITAHGKKNCDLCSAKFIHKRDYESHIHMLHGRYLYSCNTCCKKFIHEYLFLKHSQSCVQDKIKCKKYHCSVTGCEKEFKERRYLLQHVKYVHLRVKTKCKFCSKEFVHRSSMYRHRCFASCT